MEKDFSGGLSEREKKEKVVLSMDMQNASFMSASLVHDLKNGKTNINDSQLANVSNFARSLEECLPRVGKRMAMLLSRDAESSREFGNQRVFIPMSYNEISSVGALFLSNQILPPTRFLYDSFKNAYIEAQGKTDAELEDIVYQIRAKELKVPAEMIEKLKPHMDKLTEHLRELNFSANILELKEEYAKLEDEEK